MREYSDDILTGHGLLQHCFIYDAALDNAHTRLMLQIFKPPCVAKVKRKVRVRFAQNNFVATRAIWP